MTTSNKSYAQATNSKVFNWNRFFKKKTYSDNQLVNAVGFAAIWTTCACGQQCNIIPRNRDTGEPKDHTLAVLGTNFSTYIGRMSDQQLYHSGDYGTLEKFNEHKKIALQTLMDIEERSAFLIEKILKRKKRK